MQLSFQSKRDPKINSFMFNITRKVLIESAVNMNLLVDADLAEIPEVMPHLFKLAGKLRDDIYKFHNHINKNIQLPIVRNCFGYSFVKGAESAFLWHKSKDGKIDFEYDPISALKGSFENPDVPMNKVLLIEDVFVDFQDHVLTNPEHGFLKDNRLLFDVTACGIYWSAAIGLDYGMNTLGFK